MLTTSVALAILGLFVSLASASRVSNTSAECSDLVMLFARGSSSNPDGINTDIPFNNIFKDGVPDTTDPEGKRKIGSEEVPGAFFQWMEKRLIADYPHISYKAISIHNSGNMWSANGYPAVGIFNPSTINNIFDAELFWWPAGEYRGSVRSGIDELKGQVNYEVTRCPNQRIVIGGYSQGANVVGDALFEIPEAQRNLIDDVVLFGDPKFIGADYNKYNLLDKPKVYPWHRGTTGLRERGINDAREPYVPDDMKYKTISWCHEDDFVCSGFSGLGWGITNHELPSNTNSIWQGVEGALGDGHSRYPVYGVPEATEEVLANLKNHLSTLEIARGGLDPKLSSYKKAYDGTLKNSHPVDIMFSLNDTAGNEDARAQYFLNLKYILDNYKTNFPDMRVGSAMFSDMAGNTSAINQSYVAGYTRAPVQLSTSTAGIYSSSLYLYGGPGGGGDYPENHGMAIERGGMYANWRPTAKKHFVIIAERPAQGTYSFNMCNSNVVSALSQISVLPCATGNTHDTSSHPEWCLNIYHTLSGSSCPYVGTSTSTKVINRTLEDSVLLAQAKGFTVDIIQPHVARSNQPGYSPTYVSNQLKNLAESTGGLYLLYDDSAFGEPQMRDAIWQILNHDATAMSLRQFQPGSLLDFGSPATDFAPLTGLLKIPTSTPTLVTTTPVTGAESYGWDTNSDGVDDQLTNGPSAEIIIGSSLEKFIRVSAYQSPIGATKLSMVSLPITLSPAVTNTYLQGIVDGLTGTSAKRLAGSTVIDITWNAESYSTYDIVIVKDPQSGVPIATVPAQNGTYSFDPGQAFGDKVTLQLVMGSSEADPQTIDILDIYPVVPPVVVVPDPVIEVPEPIVTITEPVIIQDPVDPTNIPPPDVPIIVVEEPIIPVEPIVVVVEPTSPGLPIIIVIDPPVDLPPAVEIPPPVDPVVVVQEDVVIPPATVIEPITTPTADVGLTDDKIVTQKEPTASFVLASTTPKTVNTPNTGAEIVTGPVTGSSAQDAPSITYRPGPSTTVVASAQDVKTNPQNEVGNAQDVKTLFPEVGTSEPQGVETKVKTRNKLWLLIPVPLLLDGLFLWLFLRKSRDDEEDAENS